MAPYPTGKFINGDFVGVRKFECADTDIQALLEWYDNSANDVWPYDFGGWSTSALCQEALVEPVPKGKVTSNTSPLIDYDRAYITLTYRTKGMYDVGGYRIWEEVIPGLTPIAITRPTKLKWTDADADGNSEPLYSNFQSAQTYRTNGTYFISHFRLLASPASLTTVWGKVNSLAYQTASLGYSFGAGTLLCHGAKVTRGSPGALTSSWKQAQYEFGICMEGWNNLYRISTGGYASANLPTGALYVPQATAAFTWTSLRD